MRLSQVQVFWPAVNQLDGKWSVHEWVAKNGHVIFLQNLVAQAGGTYVQAAEGSHLIDLSSYA